MAIDPSVTAALIAAGVSLVVTLATKLWLDRRAHRSDLETEYRHEQRKNLQQLIVRYHGGLLEHAVSWNYRMLNLFANVGEGWLSRDGDYRDRSHYYFHSAAYRFLALLGLAQLFEAEQIYIDARYVEKRELEFVKFCKAFHWVMSDVALFTGLDYDQDVGPAHFTSDRLRAICEAFLADGKVPPAVRSTDPPDWCRGARAGKGVPILRWAIAGHAGSPLGSSDLSALVDDGVRDDVRL